MAAKPDSSGLLKWIAPTASIFSLIAGAYGGWAFFSGQYKKRQAIDQFLAEETVRLSAGDYGAGWKAVGQAAALDSRSARVQLAQEDLAMQWLENIQISGDETFSEIVEKLEPVLVRGASSDKDPQRQADLLAHLGWSYFLRRRESPDSPDPESAYRSAIQKDSSNAYAHAMWGHWIVWNHGALAQANQQFAAALAAQRPRRSFVRTLQIAAFMNGESSEFEEETLRVANSIRSEHGDLDPDRRTRILEIYSHRLMPPGDEAPRFLNAVPPQENLATFDWLAQGTEPNDQGQQKYFRSRLLEAAGRRNEALAGYRSVKAALRDPGPLRDATIQAIARLAGR